jgi:tetratricopeptide (TPR) repeat protein
VFGKRALDRRRMAGAVAGAGVLAIFAAGLSALSSSTIPYPSTSGPSLPAAAVDGWSLRRLSPAVDSFRAGDLKATEEYLSGGSSQQRLLFGLYAHAAGQIDPAIDALTDAHDPTGLLEDWRLYQLTDALLAGERLAAARIAGEQLLAGHPGSPLYGLAYRRNLEITYEQGDWLIALREIESARETGLEAKLSSGLAELQWLIASQQEEGERRICWPPVSSKAHCRRSR